VLRALPKRVAGGAGPAALFDPPAGTKVSSTLPILSENDPSYV
jgi:hypothetical protein